MRPELMDDPAIDPAALAGSLRFIRMVNTRLGGTAAALGPIRRWARAWPASETIRILDIGTGSADIPLAIAEWARMHDRRVHITCVDLHPATLELAARFLGRRDDIELVQADARLLMDRYGSGSFDIVHAGMFLHHLPDIEVVTMLRIMDRLALRGVIWNDLVRGPIELAIVRFITLAAPPVLRHDAAVSVENGFTRAEAKDLAARAGWLRARFHRHLFGRFTLVRGE
jgi:SAM-dependent methyltransferase